MKMISSTELCGLLEENITDLLQNDEQITVSYYGNPKIQISDKKIETNFCVHITLHEFCRASHYLLKDKLGQKEGFCVVSYNGSNGHDKKTRTIFYGRLVE